MHGIVGPETWWVRLPFRSASGEQETKPFGGCMKNTNKGFCAKSLAGGLVLCFLVSLAGAQQSEAVPKAAGSAALPKTQTAATPSAVPSSDAVVLKVGSTNVTQSQIESLLNDGPYRNRMKLNAVGRQHLAELYVRMVLLSQQALNDHLDSSPAVRHQLETLREKILAQAEYEKMRDQAQVSLEEVGRYYAEHSSEFDTIQVREFLIRKQAPSGEEGGTRLDPLDAQDAMKKALAVRQALASGDSPDKVADDFPPPDVVLIDRKPKTLRRSDMIPALEKATFGLDDGAVSEPVDAADAVIIVKVLAHKHLGQNEVMPEIEKKLRQQELDTQLDKLKKKAGIWMDDNYFKEDRATAPASAGGPTVSDASSNQ